MLENIRFIGLKCVLVGLFLCVFNAKGQSSLPFYQQYLVGANFVYNPSYIGYSDDIRVVATHQQQWMDFTDYPSTQLFGTHLNAWDRVGLGMYVFRDRNGAVSMNGINIGAGYHIPFDNHDRANQFSFGTSLSLVNQVYDWSKVVAENKADPLLFNNNTITIPYLNLGMSSSYRGLFGGISVLDIPLANNEPIVNSIEPNPSSIYLEGGYTHEISQFIDIQPSLMLRLDTNSSRIFDFNTLVDLHDGFNALIIGASYRLSFNRFGARALSISPLVKLNVKDFSFHFIYNFTASELATSFGSGFSGGISYNLANFVNVRGFRY